ncbi:MAG: arabinan endo-1,5-alpha-L-arabinosidase [Actinomycetota bacterium]|nr:arabinan endo-1,5-alpha-L-arabinosidase [Actinomycetota bacterium]
MRRKHLGAALATLAAAAATPALVAAAQTDEVPEPPADTTGTSVEIDLDLDDTASCPAPDQDGNDDEDTTTTTSPTTTSPPTTMSPPDVAEPTTTTSAPPGPAVEPPASYPQPGVVDGDTFAHDPTMVRRPDGTYLLAFTAPDIGIKTSTDRVTFSDAGTVFPDGAPWTSEYTGGDRNLWAPDLSYQDGRHLLYYSASSFGQNRSAIFLATSPTGESGTWAHEGLVVESDTGDGFNAIDPNLFVDDDGRWWLSFGSFWSGIQLVELDPATGLPLPDAPLHRIATRPSSVSGAVEAPYLVKRDGRYHLFVAFDACCRGAASTYRVMVGRADDITGPYVDRDGIPMIDGGGTEVLASHGAVHGPGHPAVLSDVDGDLLVYHYYTDSGLAQLGINALGWDDDGWPFVY